LPMVNDGGIESSKYVLREKKKSSKYVTCVPHDNVHVLVIVVYSDVIVSQIRNGVIPQQGVCYMSLGNGQGVNTPTPKS
jgi:hypothetical protein